MAGMLHDLHTYKSGSYENHAVLGAELAKEILFELQIISIEEIEMICSAIHNHSTKDDTFSSFDEVLIDADVIQHALYNISVPVKEHFKARFEKIVNEFQLGNTK